MGALYARNVDERTNDPARPRGPPPLLLVVDARTACTQLVELAVGALSYSGAQASGEHCAINQRTAVTWYQLRRPDHSVRLLTLRQLLACTILYYDHSCIALQ